MKKHRKHAKLDSPIGGKFHERELGILGAPCSVIDELIEMLRKTSSQLENIPFIDAKHRSGDHGGKIGYTDQIGWHEFKLEGQYFNKRKFFLEYAGVLINGNHFNAERQVVILNSKKKDSLFRKIDRLTNVAFIIADDINQPYDYLEEHLDLGQVPIVDIHDRDKIVSMVESCLNEVPDLIGCILMGGKSERMGKDKALIEYHGIPQYQYVGRLFDHFMMDYVISVGKDMELSQERKHCKDVFSGFGVLNGILSVLISNRNKAVMTVPVDLPLLDVEVFDTLINQRNSKKIATCFYNPNTQFPEPLVTIWEPRALEVILEFIALGYSCPRKVLINSNIEMVQMDEDFYKLTNVNTPDEMKEMINKIKH